MTDDQRTYETTDPEVAKERALSTHVGDDELSGDEQIAVTAVHVPGTPLVRKADAEASKAQHDEAPEPVITPTVEYDGIDSRTPEGAYLTRSNIVPSVLSPAYIQSAVAGQDVDLTQVTHLDDEAVAEALTNLPAAGEDDE